MTAKKIETVIPTCGNVFHDLGIQLTPTQRVKIDIAADIALTINGLGLTQAEAATLMETDQAKVSAIMRGRLTGFTLDRLIIFLLALGKDVEMNVTPVGRRRRAGKFVFNTGKATSNLSIAPRSLARPRKMAFTA